MKTGVLIGVTQINAWLAPCDRKFFTILIGNHELFLTAKPLFLAWHEFPIEIVEDHILSIGIKSGNIDTSSPVNMGSE